MGDDDGGGFGFIDYTDPDIQDLVKDEHSMHAGHGAAAAGHADHASHASPADHQGMDHAMAAAPMDHSAHTASGSDTSAHMMMSMFFHGGYNEVILFNFWKIHSLSGLLISCAVIVVLGIVYEGVKWFRVALSQSAKCVRGCGSSRRSCRCRAGLAETQQPLPVVVTESGSATTSGYTSTTGFAATASRRPVGGCCNESSSAQPLDADANHDLDGHGHSSNGTPLVETVVPPPPQTSAFGLLLLVTRPETRIVRVCACQLTQTLLYALQMTLAYALMLIAMTYNSWLFAAVILGSSLGNLLFASTKMSPQNPLLSDHCH